MYPQEVIKHEGYYTFKPIFSIHPTRQVAHASTSYKICFSCHCCTYITLTPTANRVTTIWRENEKWNLVPTRIKKGIVLYVFRVKTTIFCCIFQLELAWGCLLFYAFHISSLFVSSFVHKVFVVVVGNLLRTKKNCFGGFFSGKLQ